MLLMLSVIFLPLGESRPELTSKTLCFCLSGPGDSFVHAIIISTL